MTISKWALLLGLLYWATTTTAQRDDIPLTKEKKEYAFTSIKELKEEGAMVVRLKTNHRKIAMLEQTLRSSKLNKKQRKRYQDILNGTIERRDGFNDAITKMFLDSFTFCPVYVMFDTCSKALVGGVRKGIFNNAAKEPDASIELKEKHVFLVNYKKSGSDFPFDVLRVRRLHEKLEEPFPYYITLRESWVNQVNTPRAAQAVVQLNKRFRQFHQRALDADEKMKEREARRLANKTTAKP